MQRDPSDHGQWSTPSSTSEPSHGARGTDKPATAGGRYASERYGSLTGFPAISD